MRHFQAIIQDEVGWTIGDSEQIIGRVIRHGSHEHSSDIGCNKTVYVYTLCARIAPDDVKALPERTQTRLRKWIEENETALRERDFLDSDGNLRTIDERSLKYALERDKDIAKVVRLMKEMAIPLNLAQNYFEYEGNKYAGTRLYEYKDTPARVPVPSDKKPSDPSEVPPIPAEPREYWTTLDGWFQYVCCSHRMDFCGDIRQELAKAFGQKTTWPLASLLTHISQITNSSELEVALVLKTLPMYCVALETGWVYLTKSSVTDLDTIGLWQTLQTDLDDPWTPVPKLNNLRQMMIDNVDVDEIFGKFGKRTPYIPIGQQFTIHNIIRSPLVTDLKFDIARTAQFCGVYDNTSDNPDEYQLKILTVEKVGNRTITNKIAAHSKHDVAGLVGLVNEIDGDAGGVLAESHKKKAACDELTKRMRETGRLMPWEPESNPTLLRLMCVARAWDLIDVVHILDQMSKEIYPKLTKLCTELMPQSKNESIIAEQLDERNTTISDYTLRVLDRFQKKRPRTLSAHQYMIILEWMKKNVFEQFEKEIDVIAERINTAFSARCLKNVIPMESKKRTAHGNLKRKNK